MTAEDNKVGLREYSLYKADYFVPIYIIHYHMMILEWIRFIIRIVIFIVLFPLEILEIQL